MTLPAELVEIEGFLIEAIVTLDAMPDRERRWFRSDRAHWPDTLRETADLYSAALDRVKAGRSGYELPAVREVPTREALGRLDHYLDLLATLPKADQRLIMLRAHGMSWERIGWRVHISAYQVQRRYKAALRHCDRAGRARTPKTRGNGVSQGLAR